MQLTGKGSFSLRGGPGHAGIFWHGAKKLDPQPVLFAYEGLISVAAANDLHEKGWRSHEMSFEVLKYAFDLGVFDRRSNQMLIVCESKTKSADVDKLVTQIERCGRRGPHDKATCPGNKVGHSKYAGLIAGGPQLVWIVAPVHRRLFSPVYLNPDHVSLVEITDDEVLRKPPRRGRDEP